MSIGFAGRVVATALILGAATAGLAVAQTDLAKTVSDRQDGMKALGAALFGQVAKVVRGEEPVANALAPAERVDQLAQEVLRQYPAGSGRDAVPASRARPEVWTDAATFQAAARNFAAETAKLAAAARTGNLDAIKAQFGPTAQACGGCHEARAADGGKFRFPRN